MTLGGGGYLGVTLGYRVTEGHVEGQVEGHLEGRRRLVVGRWVTFGGELGVEGHGVGVEGRGWLPGATGFCGGLAGERDSGACVG